MSSIDWLILTVFLIALTVLGIALSRRSEGAEGFFLSNRSMPWWAVSLSLVGTQLSAGTFIGVPQLGFRSDFTFIMLLIGSTVGAVAAAIWIVPVLYRAGTLTVYGFIGMRFGEHAEKASAWFFLLGLLLAAGARHFIASIVIALMVFGSYDTPYLLTAIVLLGVVATAYTAAGGIRAVIWTDVAQVIILGATALLCVFLLFNLIPLEYPEMLQVLRDSPEGNKLRMWNAEFRLDITYTVWTAIGANALINLTQYGCDQDSVQRMLTCKSAWRASLSVIVSRIIQVPIVLIFLAIGMLLYLLYLDPEAAGVNLPEGIVADSGGVFPHFILDFLPPGILGIGIIGLLAASMSSFDSAANAMASVVQSNLRRKGQACNTDVAGNPGRELAESRRSVFLMGAALTLFAVLAVFLQRAGGKFLVDFALGIIVFSYAGLFGVFMTALFTPRGNSRSAVVALVAGAGAVVLLQPFILPHWSTFLFGESWNLAWPWWMVIGGGTAFAICALGRPGKSRETSAG